MALKVRTNELGPLWRSPILTVKLTFEILPKPVFEKIRRANPDFRIVPLLSAHNNTNIQQLTTLSFLKEVGLVTAFSFNGYSAQNFNLDLSVPIKSDANRVKLNYTVSKKVVCGIANTSAELKYPRYQYYSGSDFLITNVVLQYDEASKRSIFENL